ncbi:ArgE/DapE family deacylase [Anaerolineales bacterium]
MSDLTTLLSELVAIDSINPNFHSEQELAADAHRGEAAIGVYLVRWLMEAGIETMVQSVADGRLNVIGRVRGRGNGASLMLNAHMDTVHVQGMSAPFSPLLQEGRLYARGAYDMKSGLAAALIALKNAKQMDLRGDVLVSAVIDEEYASIGTQALLAEWERWPADAVIVTEPTELEICIAHKGFHWLEIETIGRAAHGSRPHLGIDAIMKMGQVLMQLDQLDQNLRQLSPHPLLGTPSLHAGEISGGSGLSIYPATCVLGIERRTLPGETAAIVEGQIKRILDHLQKDDPDFKALFHTLLAQPPFSVDPDAAIVTHLQSGVQSVLQREVPLVGNSFWMDAALFSEAGIPTVVFGPQGEGAHADVEWVDMASVEACAEIYTRLLASFCA